MTHMLSIAPVQTSESSISGAPVGQSSDTLLSASCVLVLWILCLLVGGVGLAIPYSRPVPPEKNAPPLQAEILEVELTPDQIVPPDIQPISEISEPPSLTELPSPPQPAAMIAVAAPSPAISFALPVEGPTRVVEAKQASYTVAKAPVEAVALPTVAKPLTFGQGEGKQPRPEYPRRATREGQEGMVLVRFMVGENGRVLSAEAKTPSPWPLLNESAVRTVREQWRFPSGSIRLYEVVIRFQLTK